MLANTEKALIERAQNGDENGFSLLLNNHYETIYRVAYRWCGHASNAEDITQLACIKLAKNISQFRFDSAFTSWLYRLVINCAKDWYKSEQRHQHELLPDDEHHQTESAQEHHIHLFQVIKIVESLGKDMKETALLVFAEGLNHREAADILEVKESTISWRVHEIRKHLLSPAQQENKQ